MQKENQNRLAQESSPYLLQHAHNPVAWYPWGEEAFEKARTENKPIFLSIGYSTCHWCHVMARESFEDEEIGRLLNQDFISIKVDKEERPDVDTVYMTVCQMLTGQGGWPLTIIMTPEQRPFFAATYLPKEGRGPMLGLKELLHRVAEAWKNDPQELLASGAQITAFLQQRFGSGKKQESPGEESWEELLDQHTRHLQREYDAENGGFGYFPKFPIPHHLLFLLRRYALHGDKKALIMTERTLEQMYRGGIYDHIGGGFCRYSTDAKWLAPHFEKMLYDNALLILAYAEAYQITGKELYRQVVQETAAYVLRELRHEGGGFYCAQDADSDGIEGKFYLFTAEEIEALLGQEEGQAFNACYDISEKGNFAGENIPNLLKNPAFATEPLEFKEQKRRLYDYRRQRMSLHKDDKILSSWNGLMIAALAAAARIFQDKSYYEAACQGAEFILKHVAEGDTLYISWRDNHRTKPGLLDDYAFFAWGLWELYQAGFEEKYLAKALAFCRKIQRDFWDEEGSGFFLIPRDGERLIYPPKEVYDGALPSGNSVAAYVLSRLALLTGDEELTALSEKTLDFLGAQSGDYPGGISFALISLELALAPPREIAGVFANGAEAAALSQFAAAHYEPNRVMLAKYPENAQALADLIPHSQGYEGQDSLPTYYICQNRACGGPVHELE